MWAQARYAHTNCYYVPFRCVLPQLCKKARRDAIWRTQFCKIKKGTIFLHLRQRSMELMNKYFLCNMNIKWIQYFSLAPFENSAVDKCTGARSRAVGHEPKITWAKSERASDRSTQRFLAKYSNSQQHNNFGRKEKQKHLVATKTWLRQRIRIHCTPSLGIHPKTFNIKLEIPWDCFRLISLLMFILLFYIGVAACSLMNNINFDLEMKKLKQTKQRVSDSKIWRERKAKRGKKKERK